MLTIDLHDKVALVVGGSRGIGRAITETFSSAGAIVTFTHTGAVDHKEEVDQLLARVRAANAKVEEEALDAKDREGTRSLVSRMVDEHGRVDVLIHNVGRNLARPTEEVSEDEWQAFLDINLTSAFNSVQAVLPYMVAVNYGKIILIGSSTVYSGGGGAIDYAAAKSGLTGIMTYLCKEYTRRGVRTNIIHPSVIDTELLGERYSTEASRQDLISQIPVGRLGRPDDIAGLAAYLASPWGDYICGQSILVDGGRTLYG